MKQDQQRVQELIEKVMGSCSLLDLKRLGGMTNRTYYARTQIQGETEPRELVVRLPGIGTEEMINRRDERISTELACSLEIDAHLYYFDEKTGEKVTDYITDSETMHPEDMRREENIVRVAKVFAKLHACGTDTGVPFDVIDMAETYENVIRKGGGFFYDDYDEVKAYIDEVKKNYLPGVKKVPCHNDALCENWVLQGGEKIYLIDWEYAGMNDPMWDLAEIAIEAGMTHDMEAALLAAYLGQEADETQWEAFGLNKVLIDYLWSLWGKTRAIYDGEELERYAYERWQRMRENMAQIRNLR